MKINVVDVSDYVKRHNEYNWIEKGDLFVDENDELVNWDAIAPLPPMGGRWGTRLWYHYKSPERILPDDFDSVMERIKEKNGLSEILFSISLDKNIKGWASYPHGISASLIYLHDLDILLTYFVSSQQEAEELVLKTRSEIEVYLPKLLGGAFSRRPTGPIVVYDKIKLLKRLCDISGLEFKETEITR